MAAFSAGLYFIVTTRGNGFCIDLPAQNVADYDGDVQKFNPTGGYTQKWDFIADPKRPDRFLIKWHSGDKYLEPDGNSNDDGAKIRFNRRNDTGYQSWRVEDAGGGHFYIINDGSGKAIDYWSDENNPGGKIRQKRQADVDQQKWALQATTP